MPQTEKKKRLLILSERFYPEEFLINDLADEWQKQGFAVDVLTQVPSYPYDKIFSGYQNRVCQTTEEQKGIKIHRVRTILGYNQSVKLKILNYVNFAWWTSWWAVFNGWRYDRVFTCHTGPLTMAAAGCICRWLWWRRTMIWTQDPWPDSIYNYYGKKPGWFWQKSVNGLVRLLYWGYTTISVSCEGFIQRVKPYTRREIFYFPQWTTQGKPLAEKATGKPVVFTFAGNVGAVQNLENTVEAFGEFNKREGKQVQLRIIGGGVYLERLQKQVAEKGYANILLPGRLPRAEMPKVFSEADVLIISLKPEFNLTVPAKFQAYIAAGRPILGIVCGETADMIQRYDLGCVANPASVESIQGAIVEMLRSTSRFCEWRKNALNLSHTQFCREEIIQSMTEKLWQ